VPVPTDLRVSVLTPPGTGAIATVRVSGTGAWEAVRAKFNPAKGTLPEVPPLHRFWFGTLGDGGDEVIVAMRQVAPEPMVEIHCHGGRRVVRWVAELFAPLALTGRGAGGEGVSSHEYALTHATTTRTAAVALDQFHGAFHRAVEAILADLPNSHAALRRLADLAPVGRHLVDPWRVVIAGPPNVGKSSLVNALAGYQRSVVAPVAGTTRDVVTVRVAFDGWPVELSDTAGLRESAEELEAAGIELARRQLAAADVVVWVIDLSEAEPVWPEFTPDLVVGNKVDLLPLTRTASPFEHIPVSATTGQGVPELIAAIVRRIVPVAPDPGEAGPFTPELADMIENADTAVHSGDLDTARRLLRSCLAVS
jgi:tRNA modification GTPase